MDSHARGHGPPGPVANNKNPPTPLWGHQAEGSLTGPLCFSPLEEKNASVKIGSRVGSRWFALVRVGLRFFTFVYVGLRWFTLVHTRSCQVMAVAGSF